jgi:hypothetical protein
MRLFVALLLAILAGPSTCIVSPVMAAKAAPCIVTPNPVSLATADGTAAFNVYATGGTPGDYYEVAFQQQGHRKQDEARSWLGAADESGNVSADIVYVDGRLSPFDREHALWPGDASVKVTRYRTGGGPGGAASLLATCTFEVTE